MRKTFYKTAPYLQNKYGYEELLPSLRAIDSGMINVFCSELLIIHKPAANKWNYSNEKNHQIIIDGIAFPYAIKKMMYPVVVRPLLDLANRRRVKLHLDYVESANTKVKTAAKRFCEEYPIQEKIKFSTLCRMFCDFKLSVF